MYRRQDTRGGGGTWTGTKVGDDRLWGRVIGRRLSTDGLEHDVYEDGERVYGQWLWPADEAMVVG